MPQARSTMLATNGWSANCKPDRRPTSSWSSAAHVPIKPQTSLTDTTPYPMWPGPEYTDDYVLNTLHQYPNLILWMAGHRHVNVVTPQPDPNGDPTLGFWEVETCSLRDFPQQFRTFDIRRNQDNTVSIIITNVDPAVQADSPAYKSRGYAIGAARVYATYPLNDTDVAILQRRAGGAINAGDAGESFRRPERY